MKVRLRLKNIVSFLFIIILIGAGVGFYFIRNITAQPPIITLLTPKEKEVVSDQQIFVKGKVSPTDSDVYVNGNKVAKNGNGEFTSVVEVPIGKSVLAISSSYLGKQSDILYPVERKRNDSEEKEYQEKLARERQIEDEKVLGITEKIRKSVESELEDDIRTLITITKQELVYEGTNQKVSGSVLNTSSVDAFDVKITAMFLDENNEIVDIQEAFVVTGSKPLTSGQTLPFVTKPTTKDFTTYKLAVDAKSATVKTPSPTLITTPTPIPITFEEDSESL